MDVLELPGMDSTVCWRRFWLQTLLQWSYGYLCHIGTASWEVYMLACDSCCSHRLLFLYAPFLVLVIVLALFYMCKNEIY